MNRAEPIRHTFDQQLVVLGMIVFFITALLTGIWKYRAMLTRSDHHAPVYVSIAHTAALHYSFACLVLLKLVELSAWSVLINALAAGVTLTFFASAIVTYIRLGWRNQTSNQFAHRTWTTTWGMYLLIVGELVGVGVLVGGVVMRYLLR